MGPAGVLTIGFDLAVTAVYPGRRPSTLRPPRDAGRWIARLLCALFALIGLVPPLLASLTRWQPVQDRASRETAHILDDQLGLRARYDVRVSLWPLSLELRDVQLDSNDGGAPALVTPRLSIKPRLFSLLAGRVDAGQIAIEEPQLRVVLRNGQLANLALRPTKPGQPSNGQLPISSLAITDARVDAEIDGVRLRS